jgi:hypothetical protein
MLLALFVLRIFLDAFTFFPPPYVNITPLINNIHVGYICQERVMMMVVNVVYSLLSKSWWFFSFCQSGTRALKISGHRSRTVIFVFLISIMSKTWLLS